MNFNIDESVYLGRGWTFPIRRDPSGRYALVTGDEDIRQAIRVILGTVPGERQMRPNFGCRIWELLFDPNTPATHALMAQYVREALAMWEPRIAVREVHVQSWQGSPGESVRNSALANGELVVVEISYEIKTTHDERSIVHPFYLSTEPGQLEEDR